MIRATTTMILGCLMCASSGCDFQLPGKPIKQTELDIHSREGFERLYFVNCLGCHGPEGRQGPARPMNDSLYLAITPTEVLESVTRNGHGSLMPGFAKTPFGGIDDEGIAALAKGMKTFWDGASGQTAPTGALPAYAYSADAGDAAIGAGSFATFCGACHGSDGTGKADGAGSVVDESYLLLVSDQALRSTVLFGRIDLGCPSYLGPYPDHPADRSLTPNEIDDITAWLVSQRVSYAKEAVQ